MNTKCKSTSDIKTGDLLIWTGDNSGGKGDFYLKLVRFFTMSDYGHVSTAWKIGETLYHVEATQPEIALNRVSFDQTFYHIPMCLEIENSHMQEFFGDKLGLKYSFIDAVCGYLGITLQDEDKWQCVELCNHFYKFMGLDVGEIYVPNKFIRAVMEKTGQPMIRYSTLHEQGVAL